MDRKLQEKLYKKYPKIFKQKDDSIKGSAMPWGLEFGSGWYILIDNLCSCIQNYLDNNKHLNMSQVETTQTKEKFGGLRFYHTGGDERVGGMVWFAERMSYSICEECGSTDNVYQTKGGWIRTLCTPCINKEKKNGK